jgi:plastocyanin
MLAKNESGGFGRRRLALGLLGALALTLACVATTLRASAPALVRIDNFSFAPEAVTVPVGTTVTWENGDDIPHSVVMSDKSFRSKPLDTHDRASFTFTKAGTLDYFCGLHPHMQGTIIVTP